MTRIGDRWFDITVLNGHAPTEDKCGYRPIMVII